MKLYNRTRCPDEVLAPLLTAAGRAVGTRTGKVIVKVTQGSRGGCQGETNSCAWVREFALATRKYTKDGKLKRRLVATDGGWIRMTLPGPHPAYDPLDQAERFYRLAVHEWAHVKDYQDGGKRFGDYNKRWANRPHEMRANRMCAEAMEREEAGQIKGRDEEILALAIWLEERGER